jgi:hypothetical protein
VREVMWLECVGGWGWLSEMSDEMSDEMRDEVR